MKKHLVRIIAITGVVLPLIASSFSRAVAQSDPQTGPFAITPVVRRGDPTLNGGTFFNCDSCNSMIAGEHGLNDLGQVVIFSLSGVGLTGPCQGVFVVSNRTGYVVADVCHQTQFGKFALFAGANINNRGDVVMNMGPVVGNAIVDMILLYSDNQLRKIVAEGDQSPTGQLFGYCGFSRPSINDNAEIGFTACLVDNQGGFAGNGILTYTAGQLRKIAVGGDPTPVGGQFVLAYGRAWPTFINNNGDVLFLASQIDLNILAPNRDGLFMETSHGMKKVQLGGDTMPNGSETPFNAFGVGTLNNGGDVVFRLRIAGEPKVGYFLYSSNGQTSTIILDRQATPIGGRYDLTEEVEDPYGPRINDNGTVAFMANISDGSPSEAIFLASPKAVLKVVAVGDRLPTGEKIRSINSFALNNLGQVAFFANGSANPFYTMPLGVFLATPVAPTITAIKLKHKKSGLMLCVDGSAMITNDTVIEINGTPLGELSYPTEFQENGGTITRVVSRDSHLEQMMQSGQPLEVTVHNPLTNLRSQPVPLSE